MKFDECGKSSLRRACELLKKASRTVPKSLLVHLRKTTTSLKPPSFLAVGCGLSQQARAPPRSRYLGTAAHSSSFLRQVLGVHDHSERGPVSYTASFFVGQASVRVIVNACGCLGTCGLGTVAGVRSRSRRCGSARRSMLLVSVAKLFLLAEI